MVQVAEESGPRGPSRWVAVVHDPGCVSTFTRHLGRWLSFHHHSGNPVQLVATLVASPGGPAGSAASLASEALLPPGALGPSLGLTGQWTLYAVDPSLTLSDLRDWFGGQPTGAWACWLPFSSEALAADAAS